MEKTANDNNKVALLIDADNTSAKYMKSIINEITSNYGILTIARAYGDWTTDNLKPWKNIMLEYSLSPVQQFANTSGKNATDSAMIIDAMDILYTKDIDVFCLATSDCDFTKIASRLRESGKKVVGMGRSQTVKAFVSACNEFKYIDIINSNDKSTDDLPDDNQTLSDAKTSLTPIDDIKSSIESLIVSNDGEIIIGTLKQLLMQKHTDFDERNYGFSKFSTFLGSFNEYELDNNKVTLKSNFNSSAEKIKEFVVKYISSKKTKHYTSNEVQNIIIKQFNNITLKSLGYSNMKSFLKSIDKISVDSDGKYFVKKQ